MRRRPIPDRDAWPWGDDHRKILKKYYYPSCVDCGEGRDNYDMNTDTIYDPESAWDGLHTHHKNGDPDDNWPGNLCVLCASCHASIHNSPRPVDTHLWDKLPWDKKAQAIETVELDVPRQEQHIFSDLQREISNNRDRYIDDPLEEYEKSVKIHDLAMAVLDLQERVNRLQRQNDDEQLKITDMCEGIGGLPARAFTSAWRDIQYKEETYYISPDVKLETALDDITNESDTKLRIAK